MDPIDWASLSVGNDSCTPSVSRRRSVTFFLVPIISSFFGIIIRMYFDDHAPPHFHAEHHGQDAVVDFDGRIIEGEIDSATARKLVRQWARLHRLELEANWKRAKKLQQLESIAPLD